jgi:hypothetical protein
MNTRLVSAALAASLLLNAVPVMAASLTVNDSGAIATKEPCSDLTGRARGACITDTLKNWNRIQYDFNKAIEAKIKVWLDDHASMGVTDEYRAALNEFRASIAAERAAFRSQLQEWRKKFFAEQKARTGTTESASMTKPLSTMSIEEASAQCTNNDGGARRQCILLKLKLRATPRTAPKTRQTIHTSTETQE